jgi:hypothetical protein
VLVLMLLMLTNKKTLIFFLSPLSSPFSYFGEQTHTGVGGSVLHPSSSVRPVVYPFLALGHRRLCLACPLDVYLQVLLHASRAICGV